MIIDLTRTDQATQPAPPESVAGYDSRDGKFFVKLPNKIDGVKEIAIEAYSIQGIQNEGLDPLQPYLIVQFDQFRKYMDEVVVGRGDKRGDRSSAVENGFPLPINSAPYTHRNFDTPRSKVWFQSDEGIRTLSDLTVVVRGPDNELPLFSRLVLYCVVVVDTDAPRRSYLPMVAYGLDDERPMAKEMRATAGAEYPANRLQRIGGLFQY